MSSVLKALRRQSSPLIAAAPRVALESAQGSSRNFSQAALLALVIVAALVSGWGLTQLLLVSSPPTQLEPAVQEARYTLGKVAIIKQPQWPSSSAAEQPVTVNQTAEDTGEAIISSAQRQAEENAISQNQAIDLNQISPELLRAFESAVSDSGTKTSVVPALSQLSTDFQRKVPSFSYDGHQYSSRAEARWVELAGMRLFEGERWRGLTIITIAPAHVVLSIDNQAFQQPALEDWTTP